MKKILLSIMLLLAVSATTMAQSVYYIHNDVKEYTSDANHTTVAFSSLWDFNGSWYYNFDPRGNNGVRQLPTNGGGTTVLDIRHNWSYRAAENVHWFTLQCVTPSYTKVVYKIDYWLKSYHFHASTAHRSAYYDYGTDPYGYWSSRSMTPNGQTYFNTASEREFSGYDVKEDYVYTENGEHGATRIAGDGNFTSTSGWKYETQYYAKTYSLPDVVVDNSKGSVETVYQRYGAITASKMRPTTTSNKVHYTNCAMNYGRSEYYYYKYLTFNANGGAGTMTQQTIENSGTLKANTFHREGFTFAGWNTKPDGSGDAYTEGQEIIANANSKGPVTLYAQWTANPIEVVFDYSCLTGISEQDGSVEDVYTNLDANSQMAENPFTNKVRVNLRDAQNNILGTSVILTAPAATNAAATITSDIATHKKATMNITVANSGSNVTSGSNCVIVLSPENYLKYSSIDFEVLNANGTAVAPLWVSSKSGTKYVFTFTGFDSENMFKLTWRVNLKGLNMYPATIFAKPMRQDETPGYIEISPLAGTDGVVCAMGGYIKDAEQKIIGAYYDGQYNVRKTCTHNVEYSYKLGLTGFHLDGINYYLDETQGGVPEDMISSEARSFSSVDHHIDYDRSNVQIPVLLLSPNGEGATVNGKENYMLYVDNHATRTVNLADFKAVRPDYNFLGWIDTHDKTLYAADDNYTFVIGTKATTTLAARWERITAPQIALSELTEVEGNFVYTVHVSDDLDDVRNVKYMYAAGTQAPAADDQGWTTLPLTEGVGNIVLPTLNDKLGMNLWVMAGNESKTSVVNLGAIRSIYRLTANANPDSHVIERIENGTWETPEEGEELEFKPDGTYTYVHHYDFYSTFFYGDRTFRTTNASAYIAQRNGDALDLILITPEEDGTVIVPAGEAVILRKNKATEGLIEFEQVAGNFHHDESNILKGVDSPKSISNTEVEKYYVLSYAQHGLGFYHPASLTLAAHKAYIELESATAAPRAFIFNFGNGNDPIATAIENTEANEEVNGPVYDIYGHVVAPSLDQAGHLANGLYIVGGKKVVINK